MIIIDHLRITGTIAIKSPLRATSISFNLNLKLNRHTRLQTGMFSSVRTAPLKLRQCSKYYSPFFTRRTIQQALAMSTISDAITKDHREIEQYYNEVINNPNDHDHQTRYGNQFVWELARHSVGEELVVYPAMEKYLGQKGKDMAESDRKEHAVVSAEQFYTDML